MPTATLSNNLNEPLSADDRRELAAAREGAKKIQSAAKVASFNGWSFGVAAALSAPFSLGSVVGLLLTLGLAIVAFNEFRGRRGLLRFDPSAASMLGWNQLFLLAMIVGYCGWNLYAGLAGDGSFTAQLEAQPELQQALGSMDDVEGLYDEVVVAVYSTVIVASIVFQGLNALYYFTRRKHVEAYVERTPEWLLELQRG
jgi:hypothetical protein